MAKDKTKGLKKYAKKKTEQCLEKVDKAIRNLSLRGHKINFNSVVKESEVSKSFLYNNQEVRERIEVLRKKQVDNQMNQQAKTKSKTAKDMVIMAKDKKIEELEKENQELKKQLKILRGKLYQNI